MEPDYDAPPATNKFNWMVIIGAIAIAELWVMLERLGVL